MALSQLTDAHLKQIAPNCPAVLRKELLQWLNIYLPLYGITTELRIAAFLANVCQETRGLTRFAESMNYSAARLHAVFPTRVSLHKAQQLCSLPLAQKERAIANFVYGGRLGNRGQNTNDGWNYRGRGGKQTTGLDNYREVERETGLPVVEQPELLEQPQYAVLSACIFWKNRSLSHLADKRQFKTLCIRINGGLNGYQDRVIYYEHALRALPDDILLKAETAPPKLSLVKQPEILDTPDEILPDDTPPDFTEDADSSVFIGENRVEEIPPDARLVKRGDRGEEVKMIQRQLYQLKFLGDVAFDGIFGRITEDAVKAFQVAASLPSDGIVGIKTRAKLFEGAEQ